MAGVGPHLAMGSIFPLRGRVVAVWGPRFGARVLGEQVLDNVPVDVSQPSFEAVVVVGQSFVIEP